MIISRSAMTIIFRRLRSVTILIVAGALVYLGVPRFFSAIATLPSSPILSKIQKDQIVDAEDLNILIKSQKRGLEWNESARRWTDLGLAQLLLANTKDNKEARDKLLETAEDSLINGLSLSPSNAFAWTRLAYVDMARNGLSKKVAQKLAFAVERAPYNRHLVFSRLQLCLLAWSHFKESSRPMILDQVRFAWQVDPRKLVSIAVERGRVNLARAALFRNSTDMERFEALLKRYKKRSP